jgi:hypothetical protein
MVDWYYIFPILPLGVYPCSPDIYNVVEKYHFTDMEMYRPLGPDVDIDI